MSELFSGATQSNWFLLSACFAGVLSFFSPCIVPILPVYLGLLTEEKGHKSLRLFGKELLLLPLLRTVLFILGLSTVFLILGFGAGVFGRFLQNEAFLFVMGLLVIGLGLHQMGAINFLALQRQKTVRIEKKRAKGMLGAYLLGLAFSFGWTPCIGPVLSAILAISASQNQPLYGMGLTALYSLGLALPFLGITLFSSFFLEKIKNIKPHLERIKQVGGALIVLMGLLLLSDKIQLLATLFN